MDTQRLILFFIFSFSLLMLWTEWEKEKRPKPVASAPAPIGVPAPSKPAPAPGPASAPTPGPTSAPAAGPQEKVASVPASPAAAAKSETVRVRTDVLIAEVDSLGGTLKRLELLKHKDAIDPAKNFELFGPEHSYSAQSGLIGEGLPNHRTPWRVQPGVRELQPGADRIELKLTADGPNGSTVEKSYTFRRDSYIADVAFEVANPGTEPLTLHAYYQVVRDGKAPAGQTAMMYTFTGAAVYTPEKAFQKIDFSDLDKNKGEFQKQATSGWIGMVQHYFVAAWLPQDKTARENYAKKLPDGLYSAGAIVAAPAIEPGGRARIGVALFAGPQEQQRLKGAAPGLDLVVDYGWLTIIAWPLFAVLEFFYKWSGNWGVAIILLTVLIKLIFFPLSAASYKSMAKMKLITPRLQKIREMYQHDRTKMNQAMMELYKTEKINPLGGCFPILVQIPVFIALYWVLLAAIELRHAPFILWIRDLSALDPYYVLPVLMTITMILQTKMNPTPPDPVQAKVMQFMPYMFSVFFFFFPAGLVLYWLVNNILSILQQWQIQRMFDRDKPAHGKR